MKKVKGATWVNRNLFISPLCIGLCKNEEDYHNELKRMNLPRSEAWPEFLTKGANATTHFFDNVKEWEHCAIVCVGSRKDRSMNQVYALLVHEAVHIWQAIKDVIGEKFPSSEFEAYSVQMISQALFQAYNDK